MSAADLPVVELGPPVFEGGARWTDLVALVQDGGGPRTVVLTTLDAGGGTAWHRHAHEQVLVVVAGAGELEFRDRRRVLGPGDVVVVPPGLPHRHAAAPDQAVTHVSVTAVGDLELLG
ncbi:cupin domain-containing protein [Kineococcus sp. LSe6-4]|uniref:Cupin domain-containing protein n=1 Tax=Kineococcus halophytocola TaxID=3234027 RepID=A0ABV4H2W3_9ACTN